MMYVITGVLAVAFTAWLIHKGKAYHGIYDDGFDLELDEDE